MYIYCDFHSYEKETNIFIKETSKGHKIYDLQRKICSPNSSLSMAEVSYIPAYFDQSFNSNKND